MGDPAGHPRTKFGSPLHLASMYLLLPARACALGGGVAQEQGTKGGRVA
jgi:hypothetical protein